MGGNLYISERMGMAAKLGWKARISIIPDLGFWSLGKEGEGR